MEGDGLETSSAVSPGAGSAGRFARAVSETADWVARHWLLVVVGALAAFLGLALAAPLLDLAGLHRASSAIYMLYGLSCHQLPQRSFFIGGEALTYDWATVQQHFGLTDGMYWQAFHRPIRDPVLGYQVALCQRDLAIFGAVLLTAVALARARRHRVRPLPLRLYALAAVPIALDGLTQLLGLRESTPLLRTLTGALFGAATALLVLPMVEEGLVDVTAGPPTAAPSNAGLHDGRPPTGNAPGTDGDAASPGAARCPSYRE